VTQALNLLPVGQIDGGRITQMGFGRRALGATSLGVYLGLSLGVIASSLSLSWVRPVSIGRFRYIAWVKCPYRVVGKASALRAGKRVSG
jgi:membrane-associated protease RseP (regulator of RpoE activity)